jgi:transposase-like protein
VKLWKENWEHVIPFLAYPPEIRKVIDTTNAVESLHMSLRKVTRNRGSFPNEESCLPDSDIRAKGRCRCSTQEVQAKKDAAKKRVLKI